MRRVEYRVVKRCLDVMIAAPALVVLSPVLVGLAAVVKLTSPGPVLYRGARVGRYGRTFAMWKFRTMRAGAPDIRNADGSTYAGRDDERVTPIGRWLRRTSLDEVPQLWNVLRGDMSLVGPRPELPDQVQYYDAGERRRLDVRPGITGLAQISGRNAIDWKARRALDVEYVASLSLRTDLRILWRTLPGVLGARGVFTHDTGQPRDR